MVVYFISGLGADERVFERLKLSDSIIVKHIKWIEPIANEPLSDYCQRLTREIDTTTEFSLIGMSFGGLAAIELNKIVTPLKTIIISSVTSEKEYSFLFRLLRTLRLHKIIPMFLLRIPNPFAYWLFGTKSQEEKTILKTYMKTVSSTYFRWSMNAVLTWKNNIRPNNLSQIHGTADKIFPFRLTHPDFAVKDGQHLMVYDRANEISSIINNLLK